MGAGRHRPRARSVHRGVAGVLASAAVVGAAMLLPRTVWSGEVMDRVQARGELAVCIWPGYYGITWRDPRTETLSGLDIDLSIAFASDLGVKLRHVDSSFARLFDDLLGDRCDIAMHAVAVLPSRQAKLAFSDPYLHSDIYGITTRSHRRVQRWADIDRPQVRVAVQAGTFMEPVMRATLKQAELVVVRPPLKREEELAAGRIDVFMTDYPFSRKLLDQADWVRLIAPPEPFHVLPYAYAVKPGDAQWLARVNAFVRTIRTDGRLQQAAQRHQLQAVVVR